VGRRVFVAALCLSACSGAASTPDTESRASVGAERPGAAPGSGGAPGGSAAPSGDADPASSITGRTPDAETPGSDAAGSAASATRADAGVGDAGGGAPDAGVALAPGSLEVSWMHGAANCAQSTDPELQVHAYGPTTYILRQDKCRTFEAPFMYLLLGAQSALLLDTGATNSPALRDAVSALAADRTLLIAHSHAHGDHVASDGRFRNQPGTTVIGTGVAAVQQAFGLNPWPTDTAELDLGGGRVLDVLAIPGHEAAHIALYDRETGLLLTGDTLYPGLLFINDWNTYRASVRRLAEFVASHPVSHVLGAHVEMTSSPGVAYAYQTVYQPAEHVLQLSPAHVLELDAALTTLGAMPPAGAVAHDDFVIVPQ
jgi:hydroxyacylglutathione hydrolase